MDPVPERPDPTVADPLSFHPVPAVVIGLMGGVAAGKSAVATLFAAHGLCHIDADRHAREVLQRPAVQAALALAFGPAILGNDGRPDRQRLAALVFTDPEVRRQLEAITHPAIRAAVDAELAVALAAGTSVLLDVPLLLEHGLIDRCAATVYVDTSFAVRAERARARGWSADELRRREAAQAPLAVKKARATYTIVNDGPLPATGQQVRGILTRILAQRP